MKCYQVFVSFSVVCQFTNVNLEEIKRRATSSCEDRGTAGLICTTCLDVSTCIDTGVGWITYPVDKCEGFERCNLQDGGCSKALGPCNSEGSIPCTGHGFFPDVFDCQRYYYCEDEGADSQLRECGRDYAFNVVDSRCTLKNTDPVCKSIPVVCSSAADRGAWPGNNNIFYVCVAAVITEDKTFIPVLFRCPFNWAYDPSKGACVDSVITTTEVSTTVGIEPVDQETALVCSEAGNHANPSDCHSYFVCYNAGLVPALRTCVKGFYFDRTMNYCIMGHCSNL